MSSNGNLARAAGLILVAAAISGGCENSEILAPSDSTMVVTASPNPAIFRETDNVLPVTLDARVRTKDGYPQQGVAVTFETTAGTFVPQTVTTMMTVETDNNSIASVTLTLDRTDPDSVDVTATSGSVTKKVTITKQLEGSAPMDGTLTLSGPSSVAIDAATTGDSFKIVSVSAILKDKAGLPVPDVSVTFELNGGCTVGTTDRYSVSTLSTGVATAEVTIPITNALQCSIFASAPPLNATISIAKSVSTAPPDAYVEITPNPPQIQIPTGQTSGDSNIDVLVLTAQSGGKAIPGISVQFSTTAGRLSGSTVVTDNTGKASVKLTMTTSDQSPATVTARAYPLQNSAEVTWTPVTP